MAVRVVSDFTSYIDHQYLLPRRDILAAPMDDVYNDQQFCLEIEQVTLSDIFTFPGTYDTAWVEVARWKAKNRDLCGIAATETCQWCVYYETNVFGANFNIRLTSPHGATTHVTGVGVASLAWRGYENITMSTNGTIDELVLETQRISALGTHTIYIWGLGIFSAS